MSKGDQNQKDDDGDDGQDDEEGQPGVPQLEHVVQVVGGEVDLQDGDLRLGYVLDQHVSVEFKQTFLSHVTHRTALRLIYLGFLCSFNPGLQT